MIEVVFDVEPVRNIFIEGPRLWAEHHTEISTYKDLVLDPDLKAYKIMDEAGYLSTYTARNKETNSLIGYNIFFLTPSMHFKNQIVASEDCLFIEKKYRGFGREFIRYADKMLKLAGATLIYRRVNIDHDHGPILRRHGYEKIDLVYGKRIYI